MTKHVSLQQLNPNALLQLKATGSCEITIPEWLFDADGAGHYLRRLKTVGLSIPCVAGPYTGVNCTLQLLKSTIRQSPLVGDMYTRQEDDSRFKDYYGTIESIVTSTAQSDSGLFEVNLRDERYLPFEGAGAESTWKLELPTGVTQFDYATISDVVLHLRYTAREGGDLLKTNARQSLVDTLKTAVDNKGALTRSFDLPHEFATEWQQFLSSDQELKITIKEEHFPYIAQQYKIDVKNIKIYVLQNLGSGGTAEECLKTVEPVTDPADLSELSDGVNGAGGVLKISPQGSFTRVDGHVFLALNYTLET